MSERVKGKTFAKKLSASTGNMFVLQEVLVLCTFFERQLQECTVDLKNRGRGKKLPKEQKLMLFEI